MKFTINSMRQFVVTLVTATLLIHCSSSPTDSKKPEPTQVPAPDLPADPEQDESNNTTAPKAEGETQPSTPSPASTVTASSVEPAAESENDEIARNVALVKEFEKKWNLTVIHSLDLTLLGRLALKKAFIGSGFSIDLPEAKSQLAMIKALDVYFGEHQDAAHLFPRRVELDTADREKNRSLSRTVFFLRKVGSSPYSLELNCNNVASSLEFLTQWMEKNKQAQTQLDELKELGMEVDVRDELELEFDFVNEVHRVVKSSIQTQAVDLLPSRLILRVEKTDLEDSAAVEATFARPEELSTSLVKKDLHLKRAYLKEHFGLHIDDRLGIGPYGLPPLNHDDNQHLDFVVSKLVRGLYRELLKTTPPREALDIDLSVGARGDGIIYKFISAKAPELDTESEPKDVKSIIEDVLCFIESKRQ